MEVNEEKLVEQKQAKGIHDRKERNRIKTKGTY